MEYSNKVMWLLTDLCGLCVAGLLLWPAPVCESDDADPDDVAVGGLGVHVALDQGLPLLDHALQLVRSQAHAVEGAKAVLALDIVADEPELPEAPLGGLLFLKVSQRHLEDTSLFKGIRYGH